MGDDGRVTSRRLYLLALVVAVVGVWALSGSGRAEVDPRQFFSDEQIARADAYRVPRYWAILGALIIDVSLLAVLAFTPVGDHLLGRLRRWPWVLGAAGAAALVVVARSLIRLPLSFWVGHVHERNWGFSTQSAAGWLVDWAKGRGISLLLTALVFTGFVSLVRLLPRTWPAAAAAGAAGLVVVFSFLWPVVIEPVFNRFQPLEDEARASQLLELSDRAGVGVDQVLVADASRRTTRENAYVSGFGETKRIVVFDTLLERAPFEEVRLIVAHELGHRKALHVEKGTALGAAAAAAAVVILWLLLRSAGVLSAARAADGADPRVLPFLLLAVTVLTLVTLAPSNWISRRFEESADRFALELTGDRETYLSAERGLFLRNLSDLDPGPVVYRFLFTHPSPAERLSYAVEEG